MNSAASGSGGGSGGGPPPPNPVLSAYENFVQQTPLVTRYVLTTLAVSWTLSWIIDPTMSLSCIPYFTLYKLELYRILTSPLVCTSLLTLIFAYLSFTDHGRRLEHALGSAAFLALLLTLTILTNTSFLVLMLLHRLLTGSQSSLLAQATGIWPILLAIIAVECSSAPMESTRRIFNLEFKTRYYPLILLGIFTLLGGFHLIYVLGVGVGYAYGLGHLDKLKVGQERLTGWENGCLANFVRRHGWVAGHAASGSGAWALPTSAAGSAGGGGGWNPATFFQGRPAGGTTPEGPGQTVAPAAPVQPAGFPSTGGRTLGSGGGASTGGAKKRPPKSEEAKHAAMVAAAERRAAEQKRAAEETTGYKSGRTDDV